ncbi:hypothetical protein SO802_015083 [Lithocarpus litseifolius]|uniref:Uncharacterized protein n=1 Tax=Lithocarpus litseifolius TaxID=425828 RepID=A0AAW2CTA4_9ROSI
MPKPFAYKDSHHVPWKYDVSLISTRIGKDEVCSNILLGLSRLTRSDRCYTPKELEKRRKEMGKGAAKPDRNRVTTEEAEEFLKIIRNSEYSVIQQLNKLPAQISILALLLSSKASRGKKRKCIGQGMSIPHIKVTFTALAEVIRSEAAWESCKEESDLACLICLCPKEFLVNAIKSPEDDLTSIIRPYVPGEIVGHWTAEPYFVVAPAE